MDDRQTIGERPSPSWFASAAIAVVLAIQSIGSIPNKNPDDRALAATDEVLASVSRLRGLAIKRPVKRGLKTRDEIEQAVVADLDEETTPEEFAATSKTLTVLGLIPADFALRDYMVKLFREQVAGFYEPKTQEFYLAAWIPVSEQRTVIAHELVHALQDQHFDLRRFEHWPRGDSDAELAVHAMIEGDAMLVMLQYGAEMGGQQLDLTKIGSLTQLMLAQSDDNDAAQFPVLSKAPAVLSDNLQFPYVYGVGFVQEVLKASSWRGVNEGYQRLPASTEQIMHPSRFLNPDNPIRIEVPDLLPALGRDWQPSNLDVNGEFGCMVLLAEFIPRPRAVAAADGWGGDRYVLYENKRTGSLVLAQFTTWDSAADAKEFFDAWCLRTEKRYQVKPPTGPNRNAQTFKTPEGLATIELRDKDVIFIEGGVDSDKLARVSRLLWESKKR
ncbi:MAG TPA: hypothetical protein VJH03_26085 [Blastocatellia bacterium]|nr:hypothetical protein [Blastocatellia bacterium]